MKWKSKRTLGPLPMRYVWLFSSILFIGFTVLGLWLINTGIKPSLMLYAESQTRKIAALVISRAVSSEIANEIGINDIVETVSPDSSDITFNTEIMNRLQTETTQLVQAQLKAIERGDTSILDSLTPELDIELDTGGLGDTEGIVYTVPLGQATNNALLGNLGPQIPIRFHAIGSVTSQIIPKMTDFGINNVFVEVSIRLSVNVQIIVPFATQLTTIEQDIPVAMGIFRGEVPDFYNVGEGMTPAIPLPPSN